MNTILQLKRCILTVSFPGTAVDSPVVVAVVVHGAFAVEQETVLAGFHRQGTVGAKEELVAELGVGVCLEDGKTKLVI